MKLSTTYPSTLYDVSADLKFEPVPADLSVRDDSYAEEYVKLVQPDELGVLWPMRLKVERDEGAFIVSDDLTGVYGEGETQAEAMAEYRAALSGLRSVLAAHEGELTPELQHRLSVLQSIVPPGD